MERTSTEEKLLEQRLLEIETERQSILDRLKKLKVPKKKTEAKDIHFQLSFSPMLGVGLLDPAVLSLHVVARPRFK